MNLDLTGRNALVCGSTQGLGLACAIELSLLGANVILFARSGKKLKAAILKLDQTKGQRHQFLVADFVDPADVKSSLDNFLATNTLKVHILVNNTGRTKRWTCTYCLRR